ncbi:MAG: hypothetical protein WBG90_08505 [Saonia sp.]
MKLFLIFIFFWTCSAAGQQTFETGKIIDSIPVSDATNETFTLYLPKSFDANKLSPIVFIFDPAGRGKTGIAPFVNVSETYGHVLVCSNAARNGPYNRNFDIADRLFAHIFSQFNIKENQIYLAGFSGGSRLVSAIAVLTEEIAGVIACGAGFAQNPLYRPSTQKFSYVGLCGDRDMNYREMIAVKNWLQKISFNHTLITYDGNHSWPASDQLLKAFDWLAIQAHKKGHSIMTDKEIYESYSRSYVLAKKSETDKDWLQATENYKRIIQTYGSFYTTDSVLQTLKSLRKRKGYKESSKSNAKALEIEAALTKTFNDRLFKDFEHPEKTDIDWWIKELEELKKTANSPNAEMRKMVERVRFNIFAIAYSRSNPNLNEANEAQKKLSDTIKKLIRPE